MYTSVNFKTKKALKEAIAAGKVVTVYEHGTGRAPRDGIVFLEGPHYPARHTWYAEAVLKDSKVVKVK